MNEDSARRITVNHEGDRVGDPSYSALMLAARITLPHFSVSEAI
jgi:hypothetical protein